MTIRHPLRGTVAGPGLVHDGRGNKITVEQYEKELDVALNKYLKEQAKIANRKPE
jgi:hypothetical protein